MAVALEQYGDLYRVGAEEAEKERRNLVRPKMRSLQVITSSASREEELHASAKMIAEEVYSESL